MPVDKVRGGYRVRSYVSGKLLKRVYKTKAAAQRAAATSKRRSMRKRSTGSRRAKKRRGYWWLKLDFGKNTQKIKSLDNLLKWDIKIWNKVVIDG